ncbi:MAG: peroxiredoxin-like family protein [Elainellaceae cyanobacterium]
MIDVYAILSQTRRQRISDGAIAPIFSGAATQKRLVVILPQLGDFDSMEYAWWIQREREQVEAKGVAVTAVGIGDRASGQRFCDFTGFPQENLFVDETAELHRQVGLYSGLTLDVPGLSDAQKAWVNLMLMCAGIRSPGTLAEVFRGYRGDRQAPQLIGDDEEVKAPPLPVLKGSFFDVVGGKDFQRPLELATLRLRNMAEVLGHWQTYVPNAAYLTQRGGTFLFDQEGTLLYEHRDPGVLGFARNMSQPLSFLDEPNIVSKRLFSQHITDASNGVNQPHRTGQF